MNNLYPGLPDYLGPKAGYFTLLHHKGPLVEWSHDVMEHIGFIKEEKASTEVPIRLRHIVHYSTKLMPDYVQKASAERQKAYTERQKALAEWQKTHAERQKAYTERQKAYAERQKAYIECHKASIECQKAEAKWQKAEAKKILVYLRKHIPDCRWNGREIVFT